MNRLLRRLSHRPLSVAISLLFLMLLLLSACGRSAIPASTTSGTTAAPAPSMATTGEQETVTAARQTTKAVRPLGGPQAQTSQLSVKTGETKVTAGKTSGNELVFIWVELENLTDTEFTVSSLLSITITDKVSGGVSMKPNVPDTLIRLASIDPEALTLDGKLAARGRITGWIYGEFPAGVSQVTVQMVLMGADGVKTEPLTVEITM